MNIEIDAGSSDVIFKDNRLKPSVTDLVGPVKAKILERLGTLPKDKVS